MRIALGRDHVLERDRDAVALGLVDEREVGVELAVARVDRRAVGIPELPRRDLAALEQPARVLGREPQRVDAAAHVQLPRPRPRARRPCASRSARRARRLPEVSGASSTPLVAASRSRPLRGRRDASLEASQRACDVSVPERETDACHVRAQAGGVRK